MRDEAQEEFENEHRLAQAALRLKRQKIPAGKVRRYGSVHDMPDATTCDVVWIDRLTGAEVFRYDGADPANTNSYYGAMSDEEMFARKDLDPYALINEVDAKPLPTFPAYYDGEWDCYGDDE